MQRCSIGLKKGNEILLSCGRSERARRWDLWRVTMNGWWERCGKHCGVVAQADIPVIDEFGCRVVYIDYGRAMIKA